MKGRRRQSQPQAEKLEPKSGIEILSGTQALIPIANLLRTDHRVRAEIATLRLRTPDCQENGLESLGPLSSSRGGAGRTLEDEAPDRSQLSYELGHSTNNKCVGGLREGVDEGKKRLAGKRKSAQKVSYLLCFYLLIMAAARVPNESDIIIIHLIMNSLIMICVRLLDQTTTPRLTTSAGWAVNDLKAMPLAQLESGKSGRMFSRHKLALEVPLRSFCRTHTGVSCLLS